MTGKPCDALAVLKAMQLSDTGFPTGAFGFSWGLEGAIAAGMVTRDSFAIWLEADLLDRWATFDRPIFARSWRSAPDHFAALDEEVDRLFWAEPLRGHSIRAGAAFLTGTAQFGDPVAQHLKQVCRQGRAMGHLAVVQGAVFASQAIPLDLTLSALLHGTAQTLISAGVRLSLISAIDGQRAYAGLQPRLSEVAAPPRPGAEPTSFAPLSEIAMLARPTAPLFIN